MSEKENRSVKMKYFMFVQNNSYGKYDITDELKEVVIIEARDSIEANEIGVSLGMYFDGVYKGIDCPCCGDRWDTALESDGESFQEAMSSVERVYYRYNIIIWLDRGRVSKIYNSERGFC